MCNVVNAGAGEKAGFLLEINCNIFVSFLRPIALGAAIFQKGKLPTVEDF
jgi:hypothetical protein